MCGNVSRESHAAAEVCAPPFFFSGALHLRSSIKKDDFDGENKSAPPPPMNNSMHVLEMIIPVFSAYLRLPTLPSNRL